MQPNHPFAFGQKVAVAGTEINGTVVGFWYEKSSCQVRVRYEAKDGGLRNDWVDATDAIAH